MQQHIEAIHCELNTIYKLAKALEHALVAKGVIFKSGFYAQNYLKLKGIQELQHYPIPVVSMANGCEVGFNLDGPYIERWISKDEALQFPYAEYISQCTRIEVYDHIDMNVDYYTDGDTEERIIKNIASSKSESVGISLYYAYEANGDILQKLLVVATDALKNKIV